MNQLTIKRSAKAFKNAKDQRNFWIVLSVLFGLSLLATYGLLVFNNPVPFDSPSFIPVVRRRFTAVVVMLVVSLCQSLSTVAFQSLTSNKIITPSLLGFDALYATIHTTTIFLFGSSVFINFSGLGPFILQIVLMVMMCLILYGWLLSGKYGDLQLMLLVGVIIGTGLRSLSSFMRRLLAPSEFDILQARLFGSVNNANIESLYLAIPLVLCVGILLVMFSHKLNALSLGKDVSTSIGVNHQRSVIYGLILVSILMSISTALVGSLTFYGFLVATLSYQMSKTYDHKHIFLMAFVIGYLVITGAYFIMNHVFNAQGVVSVIIEMVGGITFLMMILRKGSL